MNFSANQLVEDRLVSGRPCVNAAILDCGKEFRAPAELLLELEKIDTEYEAAPPGWFVYWQDPGRPLPHGQELKRYNAIMALARQWTNRLHVRRKDGRLCHIARR